MKLFGITIALAALTLVAVEATIQGFRLDELTGEAITSPLSRLSARATKDPRPLWLPKRALDAKQCEDLIVAALIAALSIGSDYDTLSKNFEVNNDPEETALVADANNTKDLLIIEAKSKGDGAASTDLRKVEFFVQEFSDRLKKLLEGEVILTPDYDTLHEHIQTFSDKMTEFNNGGCNRY
ncbi:hypothetical protein BGW39_010312 [Mortierella sp. 14UC]|nr:hypothetical protein BGW39_010312 [Mortierella sp. 14UC]